jgi:hypothetical protein
VGRRETDRLGDPALPGLAPRYCQPAVGADLRAARRDRPARRSGPTDLAAVQTAASICLAIVVASDFTDAARFRPVRRYRRSDSAFLLAVGAGAIFHFEKRA